MANDQKMSVQDKFIQEIYSKTSLPTVIYMEPPIVYVNKDAPNINEIECLEEYNFQEKKILSPKLKARAYGATQFWIERINSSYFESKEKFDEICMEQSFPSYFRDEKPDIGDEIIKEIPIEKAVHLLDIFEFSANMD
jgi:hypothetical protein